MSASDTRDASFVERPGQRPASGNGFAASAVPSNRLRKPRWRDARLVLGVVIVAVCALVGAKVVSGSHSTVAVWAATRTIPAGTVITADDLNTVQVRLTGSLPQEYVAGSTRLVGSVAVRAVGAGELVPRQGVRAGGATRYEFPLSVSAGNLPATLAVGDHVDVWIAPPSGSSTTARRAAEVWQDVVILSAGGAKDSSGVGGSDRQVVIALSQAQENALGPSLTTVASGQPYLVRRAG